MLKNEGILTQLSEKMPKIILEGLEGLEAFYRNFYFEFSLFLVRSLCKNYPNYPELHSVRVWEGHVGGAFPKAFLWKHILAVAWRVEGEKTPKIRFKKRALFEKISFFFSAKQNPKINSTLSTMINYAKIAVKTV